MNQQKNRPRRARVLAVGNQKGGVGKTTVTVHLATGLAEMGKRCLVWDLDMNCGSTRHFGIPKEMPVLGTYEVLKGDEDVKEVIINPGELEDIEIPENIALIPARRNLEGIDAIIYSENRFGNPNAVLGPLVDSLRDEFDYIFLDTAPNLTLPTAAAYNAADYFLLSAFPESFAVDGLRDALEDIGIARQQGNPRLRLIGVVLSAVDRRTSRLTRELLNFVYENFDTRGDQFIKSYKTTISRTTYISASQGQGKTMFQNHPKHKVTDQYRAVVRELEDRLAAMEKNELGQTSPPEQVEEKAVNG